MIFCVKLWILITAMTMILNLMGSSHKPCDFRPATAASILVRHENFCITRPNCAFCELYADYAADQNQICCGIRNIATFP